MHGICLLFTSELNPDDPLNKEAATTYATNVARFERNVKIALQGGCVGNEKYDCCLENSRGGYYMSY